MSDLPTLHLSPSTVIPRPTDTPRPVALMKAGDYQLLREVGRGGMGVVYEAYDPRLRRLAAVKMPLVCPHPDVLPRFQTEAEAMAQLAHPNIVGIFDVGTHNGLPFVACEFLPGASLQDRTAGKPQPPREAAELMRTLAGAVHHAHQHGVVHRDLKPANILFTADGTPKVTDFGVARVASALPPGGVALTEVGTVVGTPQYMAPEQALGLPDGTAPAVDVYALGAMLYDQLTGRPPHDGPDSLSILTAVACHDPAPPRRLVPSLPHDLETICLTALERTPARRYPSAEALADDLGRFLAGEPILAKPASFARRMWTRACRNPLLAGLSAALVVATAVGLAGVGWQWRQAVDARFTAESNATAARDAQADAEAARDVADAQRTKAEAEGQNARRSLYDSKMSVTARLIQAGETDQARRELDRTPDRGWEWFHLHRLSRPYQWRATVEGELGRLWPQVLAVSPDGQRLALTAGYAYADKNNWDRNQPFTLEVRDTAVGNISHQARDLLPVSAHQLVWLDADRMVVTTRWGHLITVRLSGDEVMRAWPCPPALTGDTPALVMLSPDGRWAVRGSGRGELSVYAPAEGREVGRFTPQSGTRATAVAVHPSGLAAVWVGPPTGPGDLLVVELPAGRVRCRLTGLDYRVAFSADGRRLAASLGTDGRHGLGVWDTADGSPVWVRPTPPGSWPEKLLFTPDGRNLVEYRHGWHHVRVWDAAAGAVRFDLARHTNVVREVAAGPDGRTLATASNDGTARLWSLADGKPLAVLPGHITGPTAWWCGGPTPAAPCWSRRLPPSGWGTACFRPGWRSPPTAGG